MFGKKGIGILKKESFFLLVVIIIANRLAFDFLFISFFLHGLDFAEGARIGTV